MSLVTCSNGHQNPVDSHFCFRCGESLLGTNTPSPASSAGLPPGTQLRNRYIIRQCLGRGGFGSTYLIEDTGRFHELFVLKELTPSLQGTYALQKAEELFEREAVMLHKLRHPQIPRFWEFFRDGKRLFLVQDYIEGQTYESILHERLSSNQRFSEVEILQLFRQLLPILSYLHSLGIIHRDISPDNIICRAQDRLPVLIDLGGVRQIAVEAATIAAGSPNPTSPPITTSHTRLGKAGYAPEEQLRLGITAPHSDLYALGVTAVVLMTGKQPQELIDPLTLEWKWQQELKLSKLLSGILDRMLAARPADRFQSAEEILQLLDNNTDNSETRAVNSAARGNALSTQAQQSNAVANNSGQGNIFDNSIEVPDGIAGWNWGAFFLPGCWCLTNQVWIGLLAWGDVLMLYHTLGLSRLGMGFILGAKGNEWAWKSRRWKSVAAFKAHQRTWAIAGFLLFITILILVGAIAFLIYVAGTTMFGR